MVPLGPPEGREPSGPSACSSRCRSSRIAVVDGSPSIAGRVSIASSRSSTARVSGASGGEYPPLARPPRPSRTPRSPRRAARWRAGRGRGRTTWRSVPAPAHLPSRSGTSGSLRPGGRGDRGSILGTRGSGDDRRAFVRDLRPRRDRGARLRLCSRFGGADLRARCGATARSHRGRSQSRRWSGAPRRDARPGSRALTRGRYGRARCPARARWRAPRSLPPPRTPRSRSTQMPVRSGRTRDPRRAQALGAFGIAPRVRSGYRRRNRTRSLTRNKQWSVVRTDNGPTRSRKRPSSRGRTVRSVRDPRRTRRRPMRTAGTPGTKRRRPRAPRPTPDRRAARRSG